LHNRSPTKTYLSTAATYRRPIVKPLPGHGCLTVLGDRPTHKASHRRRTCALMQVLARGEFNNRGPQNRTFRDHLAEKNGGQVWRLLKNCTSADSSGRWVTRIATASPTSAKKSSPPPWKSKSCCSFYNSPSARRRNSNFLAVSDRILKHRY